MRKLSLVITSLIMATMIPGSYAKATPVDPLDDLDYDMADVLEAQASLSPKPIETLDAKEARLQPTPGDGAKLVMLSEGHNPNDSMGVSTKDVVMPNGVKVRIYRPEKSDREGPLPVVVYYHGGGFVIGSLEAYDATPRETAQDVDAIVVSVDYRLAPEHKFPAAHDDAFAAYKWVLSNAASLGGDPRHIALMGESAGGNLAIDTAIAARDAHIQMPVYQVLIYPLAGTDLNTASYTENATAKPLNKAMMVWFLHRYINSPNDLLDPRLNVIGAADLRNLPPATVVTDEIDPLETEGQVLATRLTMSGVKTDLLTYHGVTHEFFGMGHVVEAATDAEERVNDNLEDAFEP